MTSEITYNIEADLTVPTGIPLRAITVEVNIEPNDASALIYGTTADGNIGYVQVGDGKNKLELPFANPHIWVKYLSGLVTFKLSTLGWREART
jgi:hypothetical protein